jgi:hypothetical protein
VRVCANNILKNICVVSAGVRRFVLVRCHNNWKREEKVAFELLSATMASPSTSSPSPPPMSTKDGLSAIIGGTVASSSAAGATADSKNP